VRTFFMKHRPYLSFCIQRVRVANVSIILFQVNIFCYPLETYVVPLHLRFNIFLIFLCLIHLVVVFQSLCLCPGETLGVPIHVFGAETHMTAIVGMALGKRAIEQPVKQHQSTTANFLLASAEVRAQQL